MLTQRPNTFLSLYFFWRQPISPLSCPLIKLTRAKKKVSTVKNVLHHEVKDLELRSHLSLDFGGLVGGHRDARSGGLGKKWGKFGAEALDINCYDLTQKL